jgi:PadR family transcriptional regulator, regulatory protein PadR
MQKGQCRWLAAQPTACAYPLAWAHSSTLCRLATMDSPKMSRTTLEVLAYFVEARDKPVYGNEIIKGTGLKSGTIYPILDRLEGAGWLTAEWEDIDQSAEKRPRRRNYRLSGLGVGAANRELDAAARAIFRSRLRPQVGGA